MMCAAVYTRSVTTLTGESAVPLAETLRSQLNNLRARVSRIDWSDMKWCACLVSLCAQRGLRARYGGWKMSIWRATLVALGVWGKGGRVSVRTCEFRWWTSPLFFSFCFTIVFFYY